MSKELPSNKNNLDKNTSEEVDLVVFFNLIGNAFQKLFNGIASIFKLLFQGLLLILSHFYKRAIWYGGALILGIAIGFYLDKTSEKLYGANMFIETNYNSGYQVYENIKNLNELARADKDTLELARILNMGASETSSLKGFYIEPETNPFEIMQMYSEFQKGLDSLSLAQSNYDDFSLSISKYNYKTHKIGVASTDKKIYNKLNKNLPVILSQNPYLDKLKEVGQENYKREEKALTNQQNKTDSLVTVYLQIRTEQSNRPNAPGSGTNLYLGNAQKNELLIDEAKLLQNILVLEEQKREVINKRIKEEDIISIISDFPSSGYDTSIWYDEKKVQIPILTVGLLFIIFLIIGLGKFLKKQEGSN